jgi:hypothetical protein
MLPWEEDWPDGQPWRVELGVRGPDVPLFEFVGDWTDDVREAWEAAGQPPVVQWRVGKVRDLSWLPASGIRDFTTSTDSGLLDDTQLAEATQLEGLRLFTSRTDPIDWTQLTRLRTYAGYPRPGSGFPTLNLEELSLWDYLGADLEPLPFGPALRRCRLSPARRLRSLAGIEKATALKDLTLGYVPAEDYEPLGRLPQLEELRLAACTGVHDLEWVGQAPNLRSLILENCKTIASFAPLLSHPTLELIGISGSTRPGDGDYRGLLRATAGQVYVETLPRTANLTRAELNERFPQL